MGLSQRQGDAVLEQLDKSYAVTLAQVTKNRDEGESGFVHGAFHLVGADNDSSLDAVVGDVKMEGNNIARLRGDLAGAVADDGWGERWKDAARSSMKALSQYPGWSQEATIDDVLAKTRDATAEQVKQDVNDVAGGALKFAWGVLPWWVIAGGVVAVGVVVFVQFRQARMVARAV